MDNYLKAVPIKNVALTLKVAGGRQVRYLQRYEVDKTRVKPGDEIEILYYTRKYGERDVQETLKVKIPEELPEGSIMLNIYNGLRVAGYDSRRAPGITFPDDIKQVAKLMSDPYDANTRVTDFNTLDRGVVIKGKEY